MNSRMMTGVHLLLFSMAAPAQARSVSDYIVQLKTGGTKKLVETVHGDPILARDILSECANADEPKIRRTCIMLVSDMKSPELIEPLRKFLKDSNAAVRRDAAQSLRIMAPNQALPWLTPLLDDPDSFTRASIVADMAIIGGTKVNAHLRRMLKDESPFVRLVAGNRLAYRNEQIPRELAISHIDSSDSKTKREAIRLLGRVGIAEDLILLDRISSEYGYSRGDAFEAAQQLRVNLAKTPEERELLLIDGFKNDNLSRWAASELVRRYRFGETGLRDVAKKVADDGTNPGRFDAKNALELIDSDSKAK